MYVQAAIEKPCRYYLQRLVLHNTTTSHTCYVLLSVQWRVREVICNTKLYQNKYHSFCCLYCRLYMCVTHNNADSNYLNYVYTMVRLGPECLKKWGKSLDILSKLVQNHSLRSWPRPHPLTRKWVWVLSILLSEQSSILNWPVSACLHIWLFCWFIFNVCTI